MCIIKIYYETGKILKSNFVHLVWKIKDLTKMLQIGKTDVLIFFPQM